MYVCVKVLLLALPCITSSGGECNRRVSCGFISVIINRQDDPRYFICKRVYKYVCTPSYQQQFVAPAVGWWLMDAGCWSSSSFYIHTDIHNVQHKTNCNGISVGHVPSQARRTYICMYDVAVGPFRFSTYCRAAHSNLHLCIRSLKRCYHLTVASSRTFRRFFFKYSFTI